MESGQDNEEGSPTEEEDVMKKIGEYTTMGQAESGISTKIQLFDGRFDTAYKIVKFSVSPEKVNLGHDAYGKLTTEDDASSTPTRWDWGSNIEVAWAGISAVTDGVAGVGEFVDPDNMVVEDLYFYGVNSDDGAVNYMIVLEKYDISDWQGALAMVRNKSQG